MNIKTTLKSSVAAAALFAIAAPVAPGVNAADDTLSSGNKNSLKISGFVAKALWYADDGYSDSAFITDGGESQSRTRWIAKGTLNENVTAGAMIEMDIPISNPQDGMTLGMGADGTESATDAGWGVRHQFVWVNHKRMGKISLGNTNTASNGRSETTFSGVNMNDASSNRTFGQGILFIDTTRGAAAPSISGVTVGAAFTNLDGRSRDDVLRYDTPRFAGLALATSYIAGGDWDVAADYRAKFGGFQVRVQGQYNNNAATSATTGGTASVSGAALHDSGVNATFAYGQRELIGPGSARRTGGDGKFWYFNVGYRAKVFGVGGTNFSFNWNRTTDLVAGNSDGDAVGFTIVQLFDPIGANMALSYRNYSYDTDTNTFEDVDVIALQTIFNF